MSAPETQTVRIPDYPESLYHADPAFGSGAIKDLAAGPAVFAAARRFPREATDAMDFGSAFHMRVLEPARYASLVVEMDEDLAFSTKAGKEFRETVGTRRGFHPDGLLFLKPKQVGVVRAMAEGVARIAEQLGLDPFAEPGVSESSFFWSEAGGVHGKARIDRELSDLPWLVDVKTTSKDLDDRSLTRYAAEFGWHVQAAWYRRGVARVRGCAPEELMFVFAVFQTVAPFTARAVVVPPETFVVADRLVERALANFAEYREAVAAGKLPRDDDARMLELRLPEWYIEATGTAG